MFQVCFSTNYNILIKKGDEVSTLRVHQWSTMAGGKPGSAPQKGRAYAGKSQFKAPTVGLEDVVFDYGAGMHPGDFQGNVKKLAEHMAGAMKRLGPLASKSIKTQTAPVFVEPEDPEIGEDGKEVKASKKEVMRFQHKYEKYLRNNSDWEESNGKVFEKFISHCTPAIKTKLKSLSGWEQANDDQNGIELVKLLHSIHFEQDGSKQSMLEIVTATKKSFLCY